MKFSGYELLARLQVVCLSLSHRARRERNSGEQNSRAKSYVQEERFSLTPPMIYRGYFLLGVFLSGHAQRTKRQRDHS